ncbi:tripartite tricarboxylate transporter TctB family protein [Histidinibacterium aquaticum]|nr:tripartite tricarboxylate transporter TctB family protein [Histidinibacterium aquaticum]
MPHPEGSPARVVNADTVTGAVTLALGLTALAMVPAQVQEDGFANFGDVRSPAFFPILSGAAVTLFSLALLIRGLLKAAPAFSVGEPRRVLAVTGALAGSTLLMFWVGYIAAAAVLIATLSVAFGNRNGLTVAGLAVVLPVGIYLLFDGVLGVLLPTGPF